MSNEKTGAEAQENLSFFQRVKKYITGGEERHVKRFHGKFLKDNEEQIAIRQKEIDDNEGRIEEINEQLQETLFKVDMDKISTIEGTNKYVPEYRNSAIEVLKKRKSLEDKNKKLKAEQDQFRELNKLVK